MCVTELFYYVTSFRETICWNEHQQKVPNFVGVCVNFKKCDAAESKCRGK